MVSKPPETWDRSTDVVVIGSGTGLAAALAADEERADVLVLEKSAEIGGTTAISGGGSWVPHSEAVIESVGKTSKEKLLTYLKKTTGPRATEEKLELYLDRSPEVFEFIEEATALEFQHVDPFPDYYPEYEGGSDRGRMIEPKLFDGTRLGEHLGDIRESPHIPAPIPMAEIQEAGGSAVFGEEADYEEIAQRMEDQKLSNGYALVAGLYDELLRRDVTFETEAPAQELVVTDGEVVGVVAEIGGESTFIKADGVILAAGGFEWDEEMRKNFLAGPLESPASQPNNEGDGIEMAAQVGAKLGNMNQAAWYPTLSIPGEQWGDGTPLYRLPQGRGLPSAILVNKAGDRFVNESANPNHVGKAMAQVAKRGKGYENLPCYQVMDQDFRDKYPIAGQVQPAQETPDWVTTADSLEELADTLGIDVESFLETVERFNEYAAEGRDPDFFSGESAYDRIHGDPRADHPTVAPVDNPPFYAIELELGCVGTKGGPVVNQDAQVIDYDEKPIPGLYASSDGTAHLMGTGYPGGGATIGPNMTFGFIAGKDAADRAAGGE